MSCGLRLCWPGRLRMRCQNITWKSKDAGDAVDSIGAGHALVEGSDEPMVHKRPAVDYLIAVKDEIWATLDDGEVYLSQGDIMI